MHKQRATSEKSFYKDMGVEGKELEFEIYQTRCHASRLLYLIRRQLVSHLNWFGDANRMDPEDVQETAETIMVLCESWDYETKQFLEHHGLEFIEANMKKIADEMDAAESAS